MEVKQSVAIRGASGNRTAIIANHNDPVFYLSRSTSWGTPVAITAASTTGARTVTVANTNASGKGFSIGDYVRIEQSNDPAWVDLKGCDGECTWCGQCGSSSGGQNCAMAQMSRVASVTVQGDNNGSDEGR